MKPLEGCRYLQQQQVAVLGLHLAEPALGACILLHAVLQPLVRVGQLVREHLPRHRRGGCHVINQG